MYETFSYKTLQYFTHILHQMKNIMNLSIATTSSVFFAVVLVVLQSVFASQGLTAVRTVETEEDVAWYLADYTARLSEKYIKEKGSFTVVLSGGTLIYTLRKLAEAPYNETVDWSKWCIFWVDERVVPPDDPESNFNLDYHGFISKVAISMNNVYPINYDESPDKVAKDYDDLLKSLVKDKTLPLSATGFPKFDLILNGIGPDGHLASLFPNRPQRYETKLWVTFITDSPKPPPSRITMTFLVINSASSIAMVVIGKELANAVGIVFGALPEPKPSLPCAEVKAEEELIWFLDKEAASKLPN